MIVLLVVLAAVVVAPMAAALLVTFASLREDSAQSLGGQPPGGLERIARRILRVPASGRYGGAGRSVPRSPVPGSPVPGSPVPGSPVPRPRLAADEQPSAPTLTMPRS
jgi:hypothetical protein